MEIKNVTNAPLGLPAKQNESVDPYDLDVRIQTLVNEKECVPSRGCGITVTCPTVCGTCVSCITCGCG